ncbi:hypothetical protein QAD02_007837 [Eretmocerus hayati]|uniref:Uncharacterized protein n=1 Tax=Eretmocerus hayati TaxID=131215 RepID=A0ACC2N4R9_9HYME|nr:hypothetical protein QAD02_007837 [Eretmocerus hayati]
MALWIDARSQFIPAHSKVAIAQLSRLADLFVNIILLSDGIFGEDEQFLEPQQVFGDFPVEEIFLQDQVGDPLDVPEAVEDERDPVFHHYEEVLHEAVQNVRQEFIDANHQAYMDLLAILRPEQAEAETRRVAQQQQLEARLENRLQQVRIEMLDRFDATRRELRNEAYDDQTEIFGSVDAVEARLAALEREVRGAIEESEREAVERMNEFENRLDRLDRRLDRCEEHQALANLLAPIDSDSDRDALEHEP